MGHMVSIVKCNSCECKWGVTYQDDSELETIECPKCHEHGVSISWLNERLTKEEQS